MSTDVTGTAALRRTAVAEARPQGARRCAAPRLDPALAHLTLPTVRAYRQMLAEEEFAAASWRRLIAVHLAALDGHSALAGWGDQLHDLDHELVGYRESALERLAGLTEELIARYHQDPRRCLAALPHDHLVGGS